MSMLLLKPQESMTRLSPVLQRRLEKLAEEHSREALTFRALTAWRPCDSSDASCGSKVRVSCDATSQVFVGMCQIAACADGSLRVH